jgi:hypothetical protein
MLLLTIACLWTWAAVHYRDAQSWLRDPQPTLFHYLLFTAVFALEAPIQLLHWLHGFWKWMPYHAPAAITAAVAAAMIRSIHRWSRTHTQVAAVAVLGLYGPIHFFFAAHSWWVWLLNPILFLLLMLGWMITAAVMVGTMLPTAPGSAAIGFIGISALAHIVWAEHTRTISLRMRDAEDWRRAEWIDPLVIAASSWSVVGFH